MKVLIVTTVWGRYEMTEVAYLGFDRIQKILKEEGIDSEVLIISSEPLHTRIAKHKGYHVTEQSNDVLGTKYNEGIKYAVDKLEWDYLMDMNSNNLLSSLYIRMWCAAAKSNVPMFGTRHFYALTPEINRFSEFNVKNRGLSGVGRGIRRDMIENCFEEGYFCPPEVISAIDAHSRRNVEKVNNIKVAAICMGEYPSVIDVKTGEDMHHHRSDPHKPKMEFFVSNWPEIMHLESIKSLVI